MQCFAFFSNRSKCRTSYNRFSLIIAAFGWEINLPEEPATADIPAEIQALAEQRWQAKQAKDWAACDQLRDQLIAQGWTVKDTADGYELEPS